MQQEIIALEMLITRHLPPYHPTLHSIRKYVMKAAESAEEITMALWHSLANMALNSSDDRQAGLQVQFCQRSIIQLLDKMAQQLDVETSARHIQALQMLCEKMEDLLLRMEGYFPLHFKHDIPLPLFVKKLVQPKLEEKLRGLNTMLDTAGIGQDFRLMLGEWVHREIEHCNRHQLTYIRQLLDALHEKTNPEQRELHELLAVYNLNHPLYFKYCNRQIELKINRLPGNTEKVSRLMLIRKRVSQFPYGERRPYDPTRPALQQQLLQWLNDEIHFYQNAPVTLLKDLTDPDEEKIRFTMNVGELAMFLSIACEAGLIKENNNRQMMETVARAFSAGSNERLNSGTLYTLYYKVNPVYYMNIRNKLQLMQHVIDNHLSQNKKEADNQPNN